MKIKTFVLIPTLTLIIFIIVTVAVVTPVVMDMTETPISTHDDTIAYNLALTGLEIALEERPVNEGSYIINFSDGQRCNIDVQLDRIVATATVGKALRTVSQELVPERNSPLPIGAVLFYTNLDDPNNVTTNNGKTIIKDLSIHGNDGELDNVNIIGDNEAKTTDFYGDETTVLRFGDSGFGSSFKITTANPADRSLDLLRGGTLAAWIKLEVPIRNQAEATNSADQNWLGKLFIKGQRSTSASNAPSGSNKNFSYSFEYYSSTYSRTPIGYRQQPEYSDWNPSFWQIWQGAPRYDGFPWSQASDPLPWNQPNWGDTYSLVLFLRDTSGNEYELNASMNLYPSRWYHVVATWNSLTTSLYINGVESNGTGYEGGISNLRSNNYPLFIGNQEIGGFAHDFNGDMTDMLILDRYTPLEEVQSLFKKRILHYPLEKQEALTVYQTNSSGSIIERIAQKMAKDNTIFLNHGYSLRNVIYDASENAFAFTGGADRVSPGFVRLALNNNYTAVCQFRITVNESGYIFYDPNKSSLYYNYNPVNNTGTLEYSILHDNQLVKTVIPYSAGEWTLFGGFADGYYIRNKSDQSNKTIIAIGSSNDRSKIRDLSRLSLGTDGTKSALKGYISEFEIYSRNLSEEELNGIVIEGD